MTTYALYFRNACSIELSDKVIITGGYDWTTRFKKASVYDLSGFVEDLPDFNVARFDHGCGSYLNENNQQAANIFHLIK